MLQYNENKKVTFSVNFASQAAVALLEYLVNDCSNEKLKKKGLMKRRNFHKWFDCSV